ncbi:Uncharacterized protein APZ42_027910 [Daphnia magna]|uniref:Uncharacterized protein n=1 Tax=Daphnia magna TaxID=35525 RepID=A0A164QYT4_9CRUS|nr:Uncharacterized protein APZ42_027910 [Daphnia magna]
MSHNKKVAKQSKVDPVPMSHRNQFFFERDRLS